MAEDKELIAKLRGTQNQSSSEVNPAQPGQVELVRRGLERVAPQMSDEEKLENTKRLLLDRNAKIKVGQEELNADDLAFMVAVSIQTIHSETDPRQEYFAWINESIQIIHEMTDNDITESDVRHREEFIDDLDQREIEIRNCLGLLRSSSSPKAKERYEFLKIKWAKLLELRSAIKNGTKDRPDAEKNPKPNQDDRINAGKYLVYLNTLQNNTEANDNGLLLLGGKNVIMGMIRNDKVDSEALIKRQRYLEALRVRRDSLIAMIGVYKQPATIEERNRLIELQKQLAELGELSNIIKFSTKSPEEVLKDPNVSVAERDQAKLYYALLQYKLEGKHIPDRVLYKLKVKSMVPDYSLAETLNARRGEHRSKEESIALINQLRGRQSFVLTPEFQQQRALQKENNGMQTLTPQRFREAMERSRAI